MIKQQILTALDENDMVIVNAGSSAGTEDYTVHILREVGEVVVHGVAIKPGKPVMLAIVKGKPVIGLPGYPVSAYIAFELFCNPVMQLFSGNESRDMKMIDAVISKRIVSSLKHREYVRVKVGKVDDKYIAAPLARGAGAAMSLVKADGFCVIEQKSEGYEAGENVKVDLYKSTDAIDNTLVSIGSHDVILDIISDMMSRQHSGMNLSSTHVGSMGGLMAMKRGETTIAPCHLLDEKTGVYNDSYVKNLFPEKDMVIIKGVERIQGIMVKKGNPLGINCIEDIVSHRFINRQRGAGTRLLFDYKLKQLGINPEEIDGYDKEATTHMAVAALISSENADAGMGIASAAVAMNLDFIEVGPAEYDFVIERKNLEKPYYS
ncbi:hypothetical protein SDC9_112216 [bioreactor metagenome]|uniref:Molybdopterin molybdotransferase n=1 Tax=bioreactor metagenome TaxID=1076179 RepID=A0A645BLA0_9ZZZZ